MKLLEIFATKLAVIMCPYGEFKQEDLGGNPYQVHYSTLFPDTFLELGWAAAILNIGTIHHDEIMAWRRTDAIA